MPTRRAARRRSTATRLPARRTSAASSRRVAASAALTSARWPQMCSVDTDERRLCVNNSACTGVTCTGANVCDSADGYCKCNGAVCQSGEACACPAGTDGGCAATQRSCRSGNACTDNSTCAARGASCDPVDGLCRRGGPGGPVCASNQLCNLGPPAQCQGGQQCTLPDGGAKSCAGGTSCDPEDGRAASAEAVAGWCARLQVGATAASSQLRSAFRTHNSGPAAARATCATLTAQRAPTASSTRRRRPPPPIARCPLTTGSTRPRARSDGLLLDQPGRPLAPLPGAGAGPDRHLSRLLRRCGGQRRVHAGATSSDLRADSSAPANYGYCNPN